MNKGWVYHDKIGKSAIAQTVLEYYSQRYKHSTIAQWQARIELGQILLNQKPTTISTKLQAGDKLSYHRPPWQEPVVPLDFQILYQDPDLLVIDKPSGLPVLAGGGFLENTLWFQLQKLFPQQTPIPIHRLGRGTSGLMILARSPVAKSKLSQQMRSRQITKIYLAIAQGIIQKDQFTIEQPIGKLAHPVLGYIYGAKSDGKYARSECQVIARQSDRTLVKVKILTGRPHQIRIHLAAIGHPLLGDPLYQIGGIPVVTASAIEDQPLSRKTQPENNPDSQPPLITPGDCGYYLHAHHLKFLHPCKNQTVNLRSAPPEIFSNQIDPKFISQIT